MISKISILSVLVGFSTIIHAQTNKLEPTGKVGVGTTNPLTNFQVQKTSAEPAMMIGGSYSGSPRLQVYGLEADGAAWMGLGTDMAGGPYEHSIYFPTVNRGRLNIGDYNGSVYNVRMTVSNNGNVGIGTEYPTTNFQVQKRSAAPAIMIGGELSGSPRLQIYGLDVDPAAWMGLGADMGGNTYEHSIYFPTHPTSGMGRLSIGDYNGNTYHTRFTVLQNGKVGIGTTNFGDETLAVNGKIHAKEVKIDADNWPDYVFEPGFVRKSLPEIEQFIAEHKHLPEIPSAKEVKDNGLELGEMNAKLLKKIEELTLLVIEQNKRLEKVEKKLSNHSN